LWKLAAEYEMARGGLTENEVIAKMVEIIRILRHSIAEGIAGTQYADRVLGHQSGRFDELMRAGKLLGGGALNRIVLYVTALMEVKSSMGVSVDGKSHARQRVDRRVHRHPLDLRRGSRRLPGRRRIRRLHGCRRTRHPGRRHSN
jgi:hypothetical protein